MGQTWMVKTNKRRAWFVAWCQGADVAARASAASTAAARPPGPMKGGVKRNETAAERATRASRAR